MISPSPDAMSFGSSARVTCNVPSTLDSHIHRQCSTSASATGSQATGAARVVHQDINPAQPVGKRSHRPFVGDVRHHRGAAYLRGEPP